MRRKKAIERPFPALTFLTTRTVRFEEVDQMRYMWHGRYPSWLEDGREALGQHYQISYLDFYAAGVLVPIRTMNLNYLSPLLYRKTYHIETNLLWNEAAILEFSYRILNENGDVMTEAETSQLMITVENEVLFESPQFYQNFCLAWKEGRLL